MITIARNVKFEFRRGAGSSLEILFGKVTLTPTLNHTVGTSVVLPAPTSYDLINGVAIATNVAPSPAPVGGVASWAYKVVVKDNYGKSWEFLVGVPDGTTEINFNVLPRYFETRPPAFGQGEQGIPGSAATIAIGTTTSGPTPAVTNTGTSTDAVLNFQLPKGDKGDTGAGVPAGGTALQVVRKNAANTTTEWATVDKALVGLNNVDNTSDANKPVSTAQQAAIDALEGRTDLNVETLVNEPLSLAYQAMAAKFVLKNELVANVLDFGAVGDGVTDDTGAFVAARNLLASQGGGTLYAPPKNYHISGVIEFTSNLTVYAPGATFLKLSGSSHQATFIAKSNGAKGYGSGGRSIVIDGPTFKGTFSGNRGNGLSLHHVEDLIVRNSKFSECVITGHAADLGGCRKIRFENTIFEGWKVSEGREFTEAIQVDYSTAATLGQDTIASSFDGLPSVDVSVERCQFIPLVIGGTTYPAPNPIGAHTRVAGNLIEDIHFINNLVQGGHGTTGFSGSTATFHKGWISLGYGKGFKINGNKFVATHTTPTRVININAPDSAYALATVADPAAVMTPTTPIPVSDFEMYGNKFVNFTSGDANSRSEPIVYLRGYSVASQAKNFMIAANTFENCSPTTEGNYQYEGQIGFNAAYIDNLTLRDISLRGISQLMLSVGCANVSLERISGFLTSIFIQDDDTTNYTLGNVDVRYPGGAQMNRTNGVYLNGTKLRSMNTVDVGSLGDRLLSLSACKNILGRDVTVDNSSGSSMVTRGLWITGSSQAGRIDQTLIRGTFTVAGVRVETNSSTVLVANSVTAV